MADDTKKILQTQLWNIANTLRGKMGADEFRDYILGFIFYKYLSERMHLFADEILKHDGIQFDQIDDSTKQGQEMLAAIQEEAIERLGYFLKPSELFHKVAEKGAQKENNFILEDLTSVLKHIESSTMGHASEDDFEGLFEDLDLGSSKLGKTENQKNELIAKVLSHLDKIDFRLADTEADVLGDAYEYLIGQFASGAGKKAGEFYTPQEVSTILAKIVTTGKKKLKSVYDPTCGSASLLLRVAKEVPDVGHFYGQEMNPTTYNLARMNMILHGVHYQRFDLKNEDTLEHPAPEHAELRFDAIVANPPFSANWSASAIHENDDRFSAYGKLAPKTKADFAFVQHMVHHLDNGATMACVLPHGVLFRGAAEGHIRKYLIEDCNYLDAVIGLPSNIFFGTGIPTCILVLKKQRENPDDILFIDASQGFEKVGNQNYLRPEHVERIVSTYRKRESIEKFSKIADRNEVASNEFNLNIARYIDTLDEVATIDLKAVASNLIALEKVTCDADETIKTYCDELGLPFPAGHNSFLLELYKKGVMQQLFSQYLRFKDDEGNYFREWEDKRIDEFAPLQRGFDLLTTDVKKGKVPVVYSNGILRTHSESKAKGPGVVTGRSGTIGKVTFVEEDYWPHNTSLWVTNFFGNQPKFVYYFYIHLGLEKFQAGSTIPTLNRNDVHEHRAAIPSPVEQTKIANFLTALDRKIEAIAGQTGSTDCFKQELSKPILPSS